MRSRFTAADNVNPPSWRDEVDRLLAAAANEQFYGIDGEFHTAEVVMSTKLLAIQSHTFAALKRVTDANTGCAIATAGIARVAGGVAGTVPVVDVGIDCVRAGTLRQGIQVANRQLPRILVERDAVILVEIRRQKGVRAEWHRQAHQGVAAVGRRYRGNGAAIRIGSVVQHRTVQAMIDAIQCMRLDDSEVIDCGHDRVTAILRILQRRGIVVAVMMAHAYLQGALRVGNRPLNCRPAALSPETSPGAAASSAVKPATVGDRYLTVLSIRLSESPLVAMMFLLSAT